MGEVDGVANGTMLNHILLGAGYTTEELSSPDNNLTSDERARIIAKAKNNLYLTDDNRMYSLRDRGMSSDMDSLGSQDTF